MGRIRKYAEKRCSGPYWVHSKTQTTTQASYNTYYIVPDFIDLFGDDWKEIKTQIEKRNIQFVKNIVLTKNWFVVSNF